MNEENKNKSNYHENMICKIRLSNVYEHGDYANANSSNIYKPIYTYKYIFISRY